MKKLILLLTALCFLLTTKAETNVEERVAALETQLNNLTSTVNTLTGSVAEVTKQNLALKQALHLQPTIAEIVTEKGVDIRLISAEGNSQSGKITLIFTVTNTTKRDLKIQHYRFTAIDVDGHKIEFDTNNCTIADESVYGITYLYPDTPLTMKFVLSPISETEYIKAINVEEYNENAAFRFTNIPIKWK